MTAHNVVVQSNYNETTGDRTRHVYCEPCNYVSPPLEPGADCVWVALAHVMTPGATQNRQPGQQNDGRDHMEANR